MRKMLRAMACSVGLCLGTVMPTGSVHADEPPAPFTMVDATCETARTQEVTTAVQGIIKTAALGACVTADSAVGKERVEQRHARLLPLILFDRSLEQAPSFQTLLRGNMLMPVEHGYQVSEGRLPIPSGFFLLGQSAKPRQVDLFVMALCPYGQTAQRALAGFLNTHPNPGVTIQLHYIVNATPYGICSMHGEAEVTENIRQLLIQRHNPDRLWKYLTARVNNQTFEQAAEAAGIKSQDILKRERKEGLELLRRDAQLTNQLHMTASPTVLWENQYVLAAFQDLKAREPFRDLVIPQQPAGRCGAGPMPPASAPTGAAAPTAPPAPQKTPATADAAPSSTAPATQPVYQ